MSNRIDGRKWSQTELANGSRLSVEAEDGTRGYMAIAWDARRGAVPIGGVYQIAVGDDGCAVGEILIDAEPVI